MASYAKAIYETLADGVVISSIPVYEPGVTRSCADELASFSGTEAQILAKRALCTTVAPVIPSGYHVEARNCSGGITSQIVVQGDNSGYTPDVVVVTPPTGGGGGGGNVLGWGDGNFTGTARQEVQSDTNNINLVVTQLDTANRRFKFTDDSSLTQDVRYSIDGDVNKSGGGTWYTKVELAAMWHPMGWPILVHKVVVQAGVPSYQYKNNPNGNQMYEALIRVN